MDESERQVDSKAPRSPALEGEICGPDQRGPKSDPPRALSAVSLEIRRDETPSEPRKNVQTRVSLKNSETPTTDRQRRFVKQYLTNGRNKVQAFLKVTPTNKRLKQSKTALEVKARHMLNSAGVQSLLNMADDYKSTEVGAVLKRYAIDEARIAEELAKIALSDPTQVMSWDGTGVQIKPSHELSDDVKGTIAEVRAMKDGPPQIKQHDKVNALLSLGKALGMFNDKTPVADNRVAVQFIIRKD